VVDLRKLARQWQQCWPDRDRSIDGFVRPDDRQQIDRLFQLLIAAYTHPDRHYHNLHHLDHFLTILDPLGQRSYRFSTNHGDRSLPPLVDPISVSLAAWFHDYIYNSQASDNELQSANAATELLTNISTLNECYTQQLLPRLDRIRQLILATCGHQTDPNDSDLCIFLDADLAILGTDPARYQAYSRAIRCEYSWVSDSDYRAGRIRVLESFLHRDRLYHTHILFTELESIARLNLETEIAMYR
jgi:predicted metal-dependent HD superfamily phosphohydrolase